MVLEISREDEKHALLDRFDHYYPWGVSRHTKPWFYPVTLVFLVY